MQIIWPGLLTEMTPPQVHMQVDVWFSATLFSIMIVGEPGDQGEVVTGTQGTGVSTPCAAAVAAATIGLDGVMQTPKGGMLVMGTKSMIVPAGMFAHMTFMVVDANVDGAAPKVQAMDAPVTTSGTGI